MSKATITARTARKSEELSRKYARAEAKHADAIALCEANKVTGPEKIGFVAFASTAMQAESERGAIAQAAFRDGVSQTFTFAQLAKLAKVKIGDLSRANLAYIANNVRFRAALVGFVFSYDTENETVSVKRIVAKAANKPAPRKAKAKPAQETAQESETAAQ